MAETLPVNIDDAVKQWAEITVDRFHEALDKYDIGRLDDELWQSISYELSRNGGSIDKVLLKFRQFGRFVDMRVGRGHPIGSLANTKKNRQYGRKHKPWYSKTRTREVAILREQLVKHYGVNTLAVLEQTMTQTEILNP